MSFPLERISRPLRRGFFVVAALMIVLLGVRYGGTIYLSNRAGESARAREAEIRQTIRELFLSRIIQLQEVAGAVASDRGILQKLVSGNAADEAGVFRQLETKRPKQELSLDVLDAQGSLLAWSGRRVYKDFNEFRERTDRDTASLIARADLHSFLSVALRIPERGIIVVASEPLEIHYPISNQFVQQTSITRALRESIGQDVELLPGKNKRSPPGEVRLRVEIEDPWGQAIGTILTNVPSIDREILDFRATIDLFLRLLGAVFSLLCLALVPRLTRESLSPWRETIVFALVLWIIRLAWKAAEFPASLVGGPLFDPLGYASTFAFGLTSSAGETLISSFALLATINFAFRKIPESSFLQEVRPFNAAQILGALAGVLGLSVLLCVLARAYGASLRSFVFDSTLQFIDPTRLVPDPLVALMHLVVIVVSVTFFLLMALSLVFMRRWVSGIFKKDTHQWAAVLGSLGVAMVVFWYFDRVPQVPFGFLLVVAVGGWLLLSFFRKSGPANFFTDWRVLVTLAVGSFVISVPVLDQKVHQKEQEGLRLQVDEVLRPADSWLSFVVSDAFRSVSNGFLEHLKEGNELRNPLRSQAAFPLWAQTLMSKEGHSSALVLYDPSGNEASRFSVGLTTYEQTEVLKRLFDADEEVLQIVERRVPNGVIQYYAFWGTIRSEDNRVVGMAAVIVSADEQRIFRGETVGPVGPTTPGSFDNRYRRTIISEFENGVLVSGSRPDFWPGGALPELIAGELRSGTKYLYSVELFDGKEFETMFGRDDAGRVVAVSVEEVGLRWHLFHLVKVIAIYIVIFGIGLLLLLSARWSDYKTAVLGFRGKLITAFVLMAAVPLLVFGYYNREFAAERLDRGVSKKLEKDLTLVHQRLMSAITDEEDFLYGVTDDFCETVASELGVDFSVYRRFEVHATSRPELYQSSILDSRIPGTAFAGLVLERQRYFQHSEKVGEIDYAVGYRPLMLDGRLLGLLGVPTLYQQQDVEEELVERNAFLLGLYSVLLVLTIASGIVLANQLSRPIRALTKAAAAVGRGNLDVVVRTKASGEVEELVGTFNRMTEELRRNREELSRIERELAWKEMAKQVAHEIKNPLTPMKLSIQHLRQAFKDKAKDLDEVVTKVTNTVMDQIDTLARIAAEFSNFARMPERKFERVDVHKLLKETIQLFSSVEGIEIHSTFYDTVPTLIADADELRRVFINLMRNSVQAMERGGKISVDTTVSRGICTVRITDTGAGIPQALQSKVFQPNFSTKTDGTGLGLAIARKVVEDLNGAISLSSIPGKGTTIEIKLPLFTGRGEG